MNDLLTTMKPFTSRDLGLPPKDTLYPAFKMRKAMDEWSEYSGVKVTVLRKRIRSGMSMQQALSSKS